MQIIPLLVAGAIFAYLFWQWSQRIGSERTRKIVGRVALMGTGLLLVFALIRFGPVVLALLPMLMLAVWRRLNSHQGFGAAYGAWPHYDNSRASHSKSQQQSAIKTRYFMMMLEHESGELSGAVIAGRYRGRQLADLSLTQLLELWDECQDDEQSVAVLEAYLDRNHDSQWRQQQTRQDQSSRGATADTPMDKQEAYAILGLSPDASTEVIKAAHRRLIQRLHPDHGGSEYLAARINKARELLLK